MSEQLVSVAAGPARVRGWRSCGSVAAGAARDGYCSSLVQSQRFAEAARSAWFRCNARPWVPGQLGSASTGVARGDRWWSSLDQLLLAQRKRDAAGQVAAEAARDRGCRISSEHLQRDADAAGVAHDSCCQRSARHRLQEQPGTATARSQGCRSGSAQIQREAAAAGAACYSCSWSSIRRGGASGAACFSCSGSSIRRGRPLELLVLAAARGRGRRPRAARISRC